MKTILLTFSLAVLAHALPAAESKSSGAKEQKRIPWPEEEYVKVEKKGKNSVAGQAFLKTRGGDVKTAAGESVSLTPATSYAKSLLSVLKFLEVAGAKRESYPEVDPRYDQFVKQTTADAAGRFTFYDVPPGEYYIYARVTWEAPSRYGPSRQGGLVYKKVLVKDDERNEFIVTD